MFLAGYRGRPAEALPLVSRTIADVVGRGEGWPVQMANWSTAVLYNGLGQYEDALAAAEAACEETYLVVGTQVALPELIEAAARAGKHIRRAQQLSEGRRPARQAHVVAAAGCRHRRASL